MSVINITEANFDKEVTESKEPVLLDFYATWCGPCKMLVPIIESISNENPDIKVGKINVDEQPGLAQSYQVSAIPTLILIESGREKAKKVGFIPKSEILSMIGKQ